MRPCAEKTCLVILTLFWIPCSLQQWRLSCVQSFLFAAWAFVSCCSVFVHLLHCKDCKKERQNYKPPHSFLSALNSTQGGQIHALLACSVLESYKESKSRTTLLSLYIYFLMVWSKLHSKTYCSPSWKLRTASPRGHYGKRLQRDSCLKKHMKKHHPLAVDSPWRHYRRDHNIRTAGRIHHQLFRLHWLVCLKKRAFW